MSVNSEILNYIEVKGLKSVELAKKMGMSKQNLSRILNSDDLKVSQLIEISKYLEVAPTYFLGGTETSTSAELKELQEDNKILKSQIKLIESNFKYIIELHFNKKIDIIKNQLSEKYEDDILDLLLKETEEEKNDLLKLDDSSEIFKLAYSMDDLSIRRSYIEKVEEILYGDEDNGMTSLSEIEIAEITANLAPIQKLGLRHSRKNKK